MIPSARYPDHYTPAGFENAGGLFGMASLVAVDPILADAYRTRHQLDEFPFYPPPSPIVTAPPGLYAWLYLPDLQPPGLTRAAPAPAECAMIAFLDGAPAVCDAWTLAASMLPGGVRAPASLPAAIVEGSARFYIVGSSAAAANPGYAAAQGKAYGAVLGFRANGR
jgi:hypothetical protein